MISIFQLSHPDLVFELTYMLQKQSNSSAVESFNQININFASELFEKYEADDQKRQFFSLTSKYIDQNLLLSVRETSFPH